MQDSNGARQRLTQAHSRLRGLFLVLIWAKNTLANQAAKKAAKRMQSARKIFLPIILGAAVQLALPPGVVPFVQCVFLVARVWWGWESFGWGAMFMAALSLGLHYFVYVNLLDAFAHDMSGEGLYDFLAANCIGQLGSIWSQWAWLALLWIPAYLLYKYGGYLSQLLSTLSGNNAAPGPEQDVPEGDSGRKGWRKVRRR